MDLTTITPTIAFQIACLVVVMILTLKVPQTGNIAMYFFTLALSIAIFAPSILSEIRRHGFIDPKIIAIFIFVFLGFAYALGIRVLMKKKFLNLVHHDDFREFANQTSQKNLMALILLYLGPLLLFIAIAIAIVSIFQKLFIAE